MRYCPLLSVMVERVFSIRAGLAASTDTPGQHAAGGIANDTGDALRVRQ